MAHTYESLYAQDSAADVGPAMPKSDATIDKENDHLKPLAYRTRIKKGGPKMKKQPRTTSSRQMEREEHFIPSR